MICWSGYASRCIPKVLLFYSIALYYISLLIGFGKYSIEWRPPICVCRLEMELLRPQYTKFDPFFLQNVKCPYVTSPKKIFGWLLLTFGGAGKLFFWGSVVLRNIWFAAENVVLMGNPYVLKGSSPFAEYVVCRGECTISFGGELFGKPLARNF